MAICCGACHIELEKDDVIVLDDFYTLWHKSCFRPDISCSVDADTYRNIISKYCIGSFMTSSCIKEAITSMKHKF